jgi:DNA (cytosine-5)-methyltransferase 1
VTVRLRVGSLCSGYGGLEMGAEAVLGPLDHIWHGEYDAAPSAVLAARWPGVPNLGDIAAITAADGWAGLPPVDLLCAGYPCQGESDAGLRRGEDDPRFRWPDVWAAIRALRPRLVFLENVRGHLNRSFPRVVADLSAIGYVLRWHCVRASDAGAAHKRERLFVVAWPAEEPAPWMRGADPAGMAGELTLLPTPTRTNANGNRTNNRGELLLPGVADLLPTPMAADSERQSATFARGNPTLLGALLPTPRTSDANGTGQHGQGGMDLRTAVALLPTPRASDGEKGGPNQRGSKGDLALPAAAMLLPTPTVADSRGTRNATAVRSEPGKNHDGWTLCDVAYADRWGAYAPAIARWEHVLGRPAPDPTVTRRGRRQLSPLFVEWLMGLPAGHVTDVVTKRGDALRVLGNGVVAQAAALALRLLLIEPERVTEEQLDLFAVGGAR